ncbi:centrosomal protein kizuna isoform X2 [Dromiciops gliroides]|uniref:centrosomal protein kizuna isoform X2 n=1 Tax=Dromiciops gliroides TaxID=33562 RepID=UPI001CC40DB0|nr:centrosomal protein kizuna isoform X2 [Dromiciops gliroides]
MAQGSARGPFPGPDYYEKLGRLQGALRDSEKKRLDLERKLYEYSQSDICRTKLQYIKLKKYLKEICESERKAHIRNQEYLKQCHQIQAHIGSFTRNTDRLQKMKVEYEAQIKKIHLSTKNSLGVKGILQDSDEKVMQVVKPAGVNTGTAMSRGLYHPATIFMGRQMSAISSTGDFSTQWKSSQPTKSFSISDPHSCQQTAERSNVTDSCGVQMNSDTQCLNKSDKIEGKTSLQIGEKMPVTSTVLSEVEQTHCLEIVSNTNNGKNHLPESKKSAKLNSLLQERLSPENRTTDLKGDSSYRSEGSEEGIVSQEHIKKKKERKKQPVPLVPVPEFCPSQNAHLEENHRALETYSDHHQDLKNQRPTKHMQEHEEESLSSNSGLTVSVSEDDPIINTTELHPNLGNRVDEVDGIEALKLIHAEEEKDTLSAEKNNCILQTISSHASEKESSANSPTRENYLTFKGFSYLLQFIENKLAQESLQSVELYQKAIIDQERFNLLISLCNQTDILKEEDLETCGAVVLHQLQRLLQHTSAKCLLPEEALIDRGSGMDEKPVSSEELSNYDPLREQLSKHVSALKKHKISLKEEVAKMFEVLIAENSNQSSTATALLKKALTEECEDRSSIHSNESSCSLPSILNDNGEIKQAKHAQWLDSIGTREQETKAYQLLKQSTLQDNRKQTEERYQKEKMGAVSELQLADLNIGSSTLKTKTSNEIGSEASFSSSEGSPLSRDESKRKITTNLKSKAFWGESDDSNSEIEAALRPRNHNTSIDDFDDFYN